MQDYKTYINSFNISIIIFGLLIIKPLLIIDAFGWYSIFEVGNMLYYIIIGYLLVPFLVAFKLNNDFHLAIALVHTLILYLIINGLNASHMSSDWRGLFFIIIFLSLDILVLASLLKYRTNNFDKNSFTSFVNPHKISKGYKWSLLKDIEKEFNHSKDGIYIYIDNFKIKRDIPNKKKAEKSKIYFKPIDTTKTILAIGKMGSGKTEFFNSILYQNQDFKIYNREIVHDVKGDITQKFYDSNTDFIFNPYDNRGCYWDIWEDMKNSEVLVLSFLINVIEYHQKEKDFFSSSASKLLSEFFIKTHFSNLSDSSVDKWMIFLNEIKKYEKSIGDDRTKSSIYANMELAIETFKLFAWQSSQSNIKVFTLSNFLNSKGRLILLNNASYSKKLYPIFTGFIAMLIEMMLSKDDTTTDLSLLLLDEYLSMKFDSDIRLKLQTQIRSKGGCLLIGIQYIDMQNKKAKQLLDSSKFATLVFNVSDNETIKHICSSYGQVQFEKEKISKSGDNITYNKEDKQENFLTSKHIQSIPQYHHLTLVPEREIFYLGYTPLINISIVNDSFVKKDMNNFYNFLYNTHNTTTLKYSFAQKRKIYLEFDKIDVDNTNYEDELDELLTKYDLIDVNLNEFFKDVI